MGGCTPLEYDFFNVLVKYNFFIVSNLFDNNNFYALSTRKLNRKCANKCIILGEALRIRGKNLNNIYLKFVEKALKWSLQGVDFQKFCGEHAPGLPEPFLFLA